MPPVNESPLGGKRSSGASHGGHGPAAASKQASAAGGGGGPGGGGSAEPIPGDLSKLGHHLTRNGKASKVVLVDFDGPILPNGGSSSSVSNSLSWSQCGGREYKVEGDTSNRLLSNTLQVSNYIFLDLWFKILLRIPGVYVLPGSQRCAGYNCSEKSLLYTAYLDMYASLCAEVLFALCQYVARASHHTVIPPRDDRPSLLRHVVARVQV